MSSNAATPDPEVNQERGQRKGPVNQDASSTPDPELDAKKTRTYFESSAAPRVLGKKTKTWRRKEDSKVVGLKNYGLEKSVYEMRHKLQYSSHDDRMSAASLASGGGKSPKDRFSVEEKEEEVKRKATRNPYVLFYLGNLAAMKVMVYYLITLETILSCTATVALTLYWYYAYPENSDWFGHSIDFVLLAFALTAPITAAMTMAFARRERALIWIADFRSWSYHLYMAHSLWDWDDSKGGRAGAEVDWLEHCDAVLAQLIGIGDELSRFLSLPTTSRSRHRHTKHGRKEAARTVEVAYHLLDSMATQRLTRLILYSERLKKIGLPSGEISRMRQYERFLSSTIEQLRMVKMYRTPQAFRSFARIFTLVLPPFYAPTYAQVAKDVNSLGVGIAFGIITALGLTALFESQQILEDPFTAYLALDGIDVREEFEVLHFAQLINTRKLVFPDAPAYPPGRRAALTSDSRRPSARHVGHPPAQSHHQLCDTGNSSILGLNIERTDSQALDAEDLTLYEEEADIELGTRMAEENMIRETAFVDSDIIDPPPRPRLGTNGSPATIRSRHHVREWSRG